MSDIKINNLGTVLGPALQKKNGEQRVSLNQSPDTFDKASFNLEEAMTSLKNLEQDIRGHKYKKYSDYDLQEIRTILEEDSSKWDAINKLSHVPYLLNDTVKEVVSQKKDVMDAVIPFVIEPSPKDGKHAKYYQYQITEMIDAAKEIGVKKVIEAQNLIKTPLDGNTITDIIKDEHLNGKIKKIAVKVSDMEKAVGADNIDEIEFKNNTYNQKEYTIQVKTKDKKVLSELLDQKMNRRAIEKMTMYENEIDGKYQIKETSDFKSNTVSKVVLKFDEFDTPYVINEIKVFKNKDGKIIKKQSTSPSEVNGVLNIKQIDANGKETIISSGKKDSKTGVVTVRKEMESADGTKTSYLYEDDPEGNRISDYKITDKNGKVLLNNSKTFEIIDENHFITSKNKEKYEITIDDHNVNVVDMNNPDKKATISIDRKIRGNKREILKSLKQMPGEELFKVAQSTKMLFGLEEEELEMSYFQPENKSIHSGSNLFIILHELGHAVDMKKMMTREEEMNSEDENDTQENRIKQMISRNKEVQQVYDKERKAFNAAFPDTQRDYIEYFIDKKHHYGGELGGLVETIAESNALLNTPKTFEKGEFRTHYLQQYFPRTIALLDKVLSESVK